MVGHSRVIGLYLPMQFEVGPRLATGVLRYVEQHPELRVYDFCSYSDHFLQEGAEPLSERPPWAGVADGAVLYIRRSPQFIDWVQKGGAPVVNTNAETIDTSIVSVFTSIADIRMAVSHLVGLGYRHFAYVGLAGSYGSGLRRAALVEELGKRNLRLHKMIEIDEALRISQYESFTRIEQANPALVNLIKSARKPLAVIARFSVFAGAVCRIASWLGLRVPEDVAVLCLIEAELVRISTPPVTAVAGPAEMVGFEAARILHRMIEGKRIQRRNVPVPPTELLVRESTVGKRRVVGDRINIARALIRNRACEKIRIQEIAQQLCMSVRTLQLQYAAAFGHSVGEEIRRVRLEKTKELLASTDLTLTQIAELVGYGDGFYLGTFFRKRTKLTPSQYRRHKSGKK